MHLLIPPPAPLHPCPVLAALTAAFPSALSHLSTQPAIQSASASEPHLGAWLISATAVLSLAALAKQFTRKPPLEAEFLTRADFQSFQDKLDRTLNALHAKLDAINDRLHDVRALVDRLDERTKNIHPHDPASAPAPAPARAAQASSQLKLCRAKTTDSQPKQIL